MQVDTGDKVFFAPWVIFTKDPEIANKFNKPIRLIPLFYKVNNSNFAPVFLVV